MILIWRLGDFLYFDVVHGKVSIPSVLALAASKEAAALEREMDLSGRSA